jgi:arylsulfatase A-like enzyme
MKSNLHITLSLIVGTVFTIAAQGNMQTEDTHRKNRPNVIFIFADDLGWGDLGCYGHPHLKTPNLDRMAASGILFTSFYVANPVCSPSRTAIMTGQYPARHGVHTAISVDREHNRQQGIVDYLDINNILLTRLFQDDGYKVGHFGKWHLGAVEDAPLPTEYGIDEYLVTNSPDAQLKGPRHESTEKMVDAAISFIEKHRDENFYVNVWTLVPHAVLAPTEEQMEPYEYLGPKGEARGKFRSAAEVYYGSVTDLDRHVGRLIDKIDELGLSDNTLIVFSSDNGPEDIHIPNSSHSGVGSPGPFRGRKRSLYEGGIRVPFIVQWGNRIPNGIVNNQSVLGAVDLLPSFCKLAGIELPGDYAGDGEDMSEALKGNDFQRSKPLLWEWRYSQAGYTFNKSPRLALRDGKWKFLMNPDGSRIELYDFEKDPQCMEMDNVAENHPKLVKRYSKILIDFEKSLPTGSLAAGSGKNVYPMPRN